MPAYTPMCQSRTLPGSRTSTFVRLPGDYSGIFCLTLAGVCLKRAVTFCDPKRPKAWLVASVVMSSLAAARADNFYHPPEWDPRKEVH
eukprot:375711-Amorphochlora_amoeboformis.AAC.3